MSGEDFVLDAFYIIQRVAALNKSGDVRVSYLASLCDISVQVPTT